MSRRLFSLGIVTILSALASPARADVAGYRCRGPTSGPVKVLKRHEACVGFEVAGKRVAFSRSASGTLIASQDSRTVVMVEDYPHAIVRNGKVEAFYDNKVHIDPDVLVVYRDGVRVAGYDLARLVKDVRRVRQSISHVHWVASLPASLDGDRFTITTVNKRKLVFETATGKLLEASDAATTTP